MASQYGKSWDEPMETTGHDDFVAGEFEDIETPEAAQSLSAVSDGGGTEVQGPMDLEGMVPSELIAACDSMAQQLIHQNVAGAMSASAGTDSYGFENIIGVGIGEKSSGGELTDELCVTVFVMHKAGVDRIAPNALIPATLPGGVRTDVVETGEIVARPYRGRYRPCPSGVSIGHPRVTAGTFGCLVRRDNRLFILSNNHVLAAENSASIGDPIVQPGTYDGGRVPADVIGRLSAFVPIRFGGPPNTVDCAIAQTSPRLVRRRNICFGRVSPLVASPSLNLLVKKAGRTTQCTQGRIVAINATLTVGFGAGPAVFVNQIVIQSLTGASFSAGGDSGSLIMTRQGNRPVGLLFAGSATHTIANPIGRVLSSFGVSVVG